MATKGRKLAVAKRIVKNAKLSPKRAAKALASIKKGNRK